ncbi:hypothetical protein LIPSTDRAFT_67122 [Lipomyces starkeyi NRRL Y-11557]|nr:hypothetical protein LIPSTDRAFT_67122 [Lipomyces starkeyi NRRL Y-11557]
MHEHGIVITAGISDIHDRANHQPDAVDNNDLDEERDGEEDGEEDVEHIVRGASLTEVWDDVLASSLYLGWGMSFSFEFDLLFEGLPGIVCILRQG